MAQCVWSDASKAFSHSILTSMFSVPAEGGEKKEKKKIAAQDSDSDLFLFYIHSRSCSETESEQQLSMAQLFQQDIGIAALSAD